jgi:hypothetical protein
MPQNNTLTKLFKDIVIKEDLIDTGALLKSIRVFNDYNRDILQINITSKYYVKYLKDRYHLVEQFKNNPVFVNEIGLLLLPLLDIQLYNIVNNIPGSTRFDPQVKILINGR